MSYVKTNWVNGTTPVNADNMNKIEDELEALDQSSGGGGKIYEHQFTVVWNTDSSEPDEYTTTLTALSTSATQITWANFQTEKNHILLYKPDTFMQNYPHMDDAILTFLVSAKKDLSSIVYEDEGYLYDKGDWNLLITNITNDTVTEL